MQSRLFRTWSETTTLVFPRGGSNIAHVVDIRSEILQQLDDVVKAKFDELSMIKTGLEEDIDTLTTLCEETEKLLQFDSEITTYADVHRAETLQKAFGYGL